MNSLDKGTQLVSIPNVEICHNQGALEKEDIGRNISVSTNKEDKSKRLSEFDVVISATKQRQLIGWLLVGPLWRIILVHQVSRIIIH